MATREPDNPVRRNSTETFKPCSIAISYLTFPFETELLTVTILLAAKQCPVNKYNKNHNILVLTDHLAMAQGQLSLPGESKQINHQVTFISNFII